MKDEKYERLSLKYEFELAVREEKEFTKQTFIVYFLNVVKLGFFFYLALHFNHWWIVLFSIIFQQSITRYRTTGDNENDEERN